MALPPPRDPDAPIDALVATRFYVRLWKVTLPFRVSFVWYFGLCAKE